MSTPSTRFNIISAGGDGVGLGPILSRAGDEVRVWIADKDSVEIGTGLFEKVDSFEKLVEKADRQQDVFIFDMTSLGVYAEWLREHGYAVFGGGVIHDKLERDREFGFETMKEAGINIPHTVPFDSWEEAHAFIKRNATARYVFKASGALGDSVPSYVAFDADDMLEHLDAAKAKIRLEKPSFELQEFWPGVAVSSECWFDGREFLPLFNHTFERKQLMPDDLGPSGGCAGNVVWACDGQCPLCAELKKLKPFLSKNYYEGMLDLNAIVRKDGIYGLEFTPRMGYDATPTLLLGLVGRTGIGRFIADVARGQLSSVTSPLKEGFAGGVRVSIPPYPSASDAQPAAREVPIRGVDEATFNRLFLYDVMEDKDSQELCSAGASGALFVANGTGDTIKRSLSVPYKIAKQVRVPNKQYRTDLADRFEEDMSGLHDALG